MSATYRLSAILVCDVCQDNTLLFDRTSKSAQGMMRDHRTEARAAGWQLPAGGTGANRCPLCASVRE